jgi:hypothetical protein
MDNIQKHSSCINVPSSQILKSYYKRGYKPDVLIEYLWKQWASGKKSWRKA